MDYYSCRKYTLQGDNKLYNDGDIFDSIEWYDTDYDITRYLEDVKIDNIGENVLRIDTDRKWGRFEDIYICDIINIK